MPELLLELLSEEIPARMQDRARDDLERHLTDGLKKAGLGFTDVRTFSTPRRIAVAVDGLPEQQPDVRQERKGPRVGSPDKAIEGFLRSVDFDSVDQCEVRDIKGSDFYFAVVERKGAPTADALGDIVLSSIRSLGWPKSMRWGGTNFSWVRPLQNVLCVFNGAPVPGAIDLGGGISLSFNNKTVGHRFLSPDELSVRAAGDYLSSLNDGFVIADAAHRKERIETAAKALTESQGYVLREDPALLGEVTGLVEWPVPVMGVIDDAFMDLPPEVLVTSMRSHQKYFAVETEDGAMAPRFVTIANMETPDGGQAVAAGNERVLRARLADAKFFWDQDRSTTLRDRVDGLDTITFHAQLGSIGSKVRRVEALAVDLADMTGADGQAAGQAARLAKADLTTGMVGEFPELQGIMGRYYAVNDGEPPEVAEAIARHYAPQGPSDECPKEPVTVAVSLADKIDTLAAFWLIEETPTGSRDPFGLRRAALGIVRLILENQLRLPLVGLLQQAAEQASLSAFESEVALKQAALDDVGVGEIPIVATAEIETEDHAEYGEVFSSTLLAFRFIVDRLKTHLREDGVRHDLVTAVFALGEEDDLIRLLARVNALSALLQSDDGENLLVAYRRAANILRIEEKKDGRRHDGAVSHDLLKTSEEAALAEALKVTAERVQRHVDLDEFAEAMTALAALRRPMDSFFENVKVNDEDPALRQNRLHLLSSIRGVMDDVADFSQIEG